MMNVKIYYQKAVQASILMSLIVVSVFVLSNNIKETKTNFSHFHMGVISTSVGNWIPAIGAQDLIVFDGRCMGFSVTKGLGDPATKFTIQLSKSSSMSSPISSIATIPAGATYISHEIKGLAGNTTYYYRVKGDNGVRSEWSGIKSVTTPAALAPGAMLACM